MSHDPTRYRVMIRGEDNSLWCEANNKTLEWCEENGESLCFEYENAQWFLEVEESSLPYFLQEQQS